MSTPLLPLSGKLALITGASRGLGRTMALSLARSGASTLLTYTTPSSAPLMTSLLSEIASLPHSPPAHAVKVDLSLPSAPATVLAALDEGFGSDAVVNILVNNAAVEVVKGLGEITVGDYSTVFDLNVRGVVLLTQAAVGRFDPAGGNRVINIGSVAARCGFAKLGLYCASKAALEGLTRCWAAELGGDGTTVNQVNPGPVQTEMLEKILEEIVRGQKERTPLQGRVGTVEEIAGVVVWLAGGGSSWVTGQVICASGGLEMY